MFKTFFVCTCFCLLTNGLISTTSIECHTIFSDLQNALSVVSCPEGCREVGGYLCGNVSVFSGDSNVCLAAIHAGLLQEYNKEVAVDQNPSTSATLFTNINDIDSKRCSSTGSDYFFLGHLKISASSTTFSEECFENRDFEECYAGIKSGEISDLQMLASRWILSNSPSRGRLDGPGYWQAPDVPARQYILVDFVEPKSIFGIVTQGNGLDEWVTSFEIHYNHYIWAPWVSIKDDIGNNKIFDGNQDGKSHKINRFDQPIKATFFRLVVRDFENHPSLRLEYLTC